MKRRWYLMSFGLGISLAVCFVPLLGWAEVTLDGSLGPSGILTGPDYAITAGLGRQVGGNLFHSFGDFNLRLGESATFSGPNSVSNIIARVTGGHESSIDGLLRSTIPGADLFLLNPVGVVFGPHASLDLQGSFHVSTADYLSLGKEGRFDATHPEASELTVDPPAAFGFLGPAPAGIRFDGSQIIVPTGKTISVVGGDISTEAGSTLQAESGRINLISAWSEGEVLLSDMKMDSFANLGGITIAAGSSVDVSGAGGGEMFICANQLVLDGSELYSRTTGAQNGKGIDIGVGSLNIQGDRCFCRCP